MFSARSRHFLSFFTSFSSARSSVLRSRDSTGEQMDVHPPSSFGRRLCFQFWDLRGRFRKSTAPWNTFPHSFYRFEINKSQISDFCHLTLIVLCHMTCGHSLVRFKGLLRFPSSMCRLHFYFIYFTSYFIHFYNLHLKSHEENTECI